jgi:hypothetical protein
LFYTQTSDVEETVFPYALVKKTIEKPVLPRKPSTRVVTIWLDDGLICSSNGDTVTEIINFLSKHLDMRSSPENIFVVMSIYRDRVNRTLYVS